MRIFALLLAIFVGVSGAHATNFIFGTGVGLNPGFAQRDPVVVGAEASLTLMAPGTYTAASWSISGELKLAAPGNYILVATAGSIAINRSAVVRGPDGAVGNAAQLTLVHAGDLITPVSQIDPSVITKRDVTPPVESPPLVNLSTRATLAAGQSHTSGFVVGGRTPRRVLVRAVGPGLGMFGFSNALLAPVLTVFDPQGPVGTNSRWDGDPALQAAFLKVGAFQLPPTSRDAALLLTLNPGSYTVQVGGGAGEVLLEIYYVE